MPRKVNPTDQIDVSNKPPHRSPGLARRIKYEALMPDEFNYIPSRRRKELDRNVSISPTDAEESYEQELRTAYFSDHPAEEEVYSVPTEYDEDFISQSPLSLIKHYGPRNTTETSYVEWRRLVEEVLAREELADAYIALKRAHTTPDNYNDWKIHSEILFIQYKRTPRIQFSKTQTKRPFLQHLFKMKNKNKNGRFYVDEVFDEFSEQYAKADRKRKRKRSQARFTPYKTLEAYFRQLTKKQFDVLFTCLDKDTGHWEFRPPVLPHIKLDIRLTPKP